MTSHRFIQTNLSSIINIIWENLAADVAGDSFTLAAHSDKTVHVFGEFDGASVAIEGSNDPIAESDPDNADWQTLLDPLGNALSINSNDIIQLLENTLHVRPVVVGGGASTAVNVSIVGKKVR